MLVCLFGPTVVFSMVGYKSLQTLGRRPSRASRALTLLVVKLAVTSGILIGLLMLLVKLYAD